MESGGCGAILRFGRDGFGFENHDRSTFVYRHQHSLIVGYFTQYRLSRRRIALSHFQVAPLWGPAMKHFVLRIFARL